MRRVGIVVLAVCGLFAISAVSGADTKPADAKKPAPPPDPATTVQASDSPLVRAAKISLQSRLHPKSKIVIDSTTLVVSRWTEPAAAPAAAAGPETQGRSYASGNGSQATEVAERERKEAAQRNAAEVARQAALRQEQAYMAAQDQEPYAEVIDDYVTKRLEEIPAEMKKKPPM